MKSTASLNRRAKLVEEAQAAGDRVIEAAQAWEAAWSGKTTVPDWRAVNATLSAAVRALNAAIARAERASC